MQRSVLASVHLTRETEERASDCRLSAEGFREVTLLGQNVNSYNDRSEWEAAGSSGDGGTVGGVGGGEKQLSAEGFTEIYKRQRVGEPGVSILEAVRFG
jgi:hypothetical protein